MNNLAVYNISVYATGNTALLLGCLATYVPTVITQQMSFSPDNAFRIQYIRLISPHIYGSFQTTDKKCMDSSTLCVLTKADEFVYLNRNLDT